MAVLFCLMSQGWRQLLVSERFSGRLYRLKSNGEGGEPRTCFALENICSSGWLEVTSDLLKHPSSLGTDRYFGGFYPVVAPE